MIRSGLLFHIPLHTIFCLAPLHFSLFCIIISHEKQNTSAGRAFHSENAEIEPLNLLG